jgi:hypothetical protein
MKPLLISETEEVGRAAAGRPGLVWRINADINVGLGFGV